MDTISPINPNSTIPLQPTDSQFSSLPTNEPKVVSTQPKSKRSPILIVGVVIFVLILVFAGYQLFKTSGKTSNNQNPAPTPVAASISPTTNPTDTSSWQVFEDPTFGFQIKYPADMIKPLEKTLDNGMLENTSTFFFTSLEENSDSMIIFIEPNINNLSSEEFIRQQVEETNQGEGPPSQVDPNLGNSLMINSLSAFQIRNVFAFDRSDVVTVICNPKYCASVIYVDGDYPNSNYPEAEKYSAIFDQMLQTFKFVTATATTAPSLKNPVLKSPTSPSQSGSNEMQTCYSNIQSKANQTCIEKTGYNPVDSPDWIDQTDSERQLAEAFFLCYDAELAKESKLCQTNYPELSSQQNAYYDCLGKSVDIQKYCGETTGYLESSGFPSEKEDAYWNCLIEEREKKEQDCKNQTGYSGS